MVYSFNEKQKALIRQLGLDPEKDYEEDGEELLDVVADHLLSVGLKEGQDETNAIGDVCEDIITIITREY